MREIKENIARTTDQLISKIGNPVSPMVVLAALESFGIREKDVFKDFGFVTLMDLSKHLYQELKNKDPKTLQNDNERAKKRRKEKQLPVSSYLWVKTRLFAQFYPLGIFHLLPIFLQVAAIIIFGYSLWTFIGFNIVQSTAVVAGVILGLIISGGYVQVMGRQASFYWHHREYVKAKMVIDKIIGSGIKGILYTFFALALINFFLSLYPSSFVLITLFYALLIGMLLLVMAPFHTIKKRWAISLAVMLATGIALALHFYTSLNVYVTHWIGIASAILLSKALLEYFFMGKKARTVSNTTAPKQLMVIYQNYPYFFYGMLIYIFVFIDRILAWSADMMLTRQFLLLYEKDYEIGMDLAILMFFMLAGVMEYAIAAFSKFMDVYQSNTPFSERNNFNRRFRSMYRGHIAILFITALGTAGLIYLVITQPWGYEAQFGETLNQLSVKVCILGGIGYFFLTWGMLNSLYLFTLNRPKNALNALGIACLVNFGVGFLLSRFVSYEYSVWGMLVGALVFAGLTIKETAHFFKRLDYHYYAAY
ncbi:hypothetical protein [Maribacter sp. 2-571]|uniref:hypothetical protein n=1 Tax=Maribacter sp. 2-571 TaxID=3417569 RepID=UPI003D34B436